jgi:hypothetical protein
MMVLSLVSLPNSPPQKLSEYHFYFRIRNKKEKIRCLLKKWTGVLTLPLPDAPAGFEPAYPKGSCLADCRVFHFAMERL